MQFKDNLSFSRQKLEFYYSIFLLITIPVLLAVNTIFLNRTFRSQFNSEIRSKASLFNDSVVQVTQVGNLNQTLLQNYVNAATEDIGDLLQLEILVPNKDSFQVVASDNPQRIDQQLTSAEVLQESLVASQQRAIAAEVYYAEDGQNAWRVVNPVVDEDGVTEAVVISAVSRASADQLATQAFQRSMIIMGVTIGVVVLLLLNHFRFVEYAVLFRKLKELDQLKNDFLNVASHELKAPMTIIRGQISMVLDGDTGKISKKTKESLEQVMTSSTQLTNLVEDLLNVSRIEDGRMKYDITTVELPSIIEPIVDSYQEAAKEKGITIEYTPSDNAIVQADEGKTREIFTNLIDNAVKYSRSGMVSIKHELVEEFVVTSVKDTGIGMSAEERARLFQRFSRIQNESTQGIRGTGLGLWIIKQYVEAMSGRIDVDSIKGTGSEFSVRLPHTK